MNEITYRNEAGFRLPNLLPPQEAETPLGKYASLRRQYLQQHQRVVYTTLLTSGKLTEHLAEIEQAAKRRVEQITREMAREQGVDESMKAKDQMQWVGLMNNIRQAAEESVLTELICQPMSR